MSAPTRSPFYHRQLEIVISHICLRVVRAVFELNLHPVPELRYINRAANRSQAPHLEWLASSTLNCCICAIVIPSADMLHR